MCRRTSHTKVNGLRLGQWGATEQNVSAPEETKSNPTENGQIAFPTKRVTL